MPSDHQSTHIVTRLREWTADDMDTCAVLSRNGQRVADVPWARHGTDLAEAIFDAAEEIQRLQRFVQFVADYSNDPAVVREAKAHGAK